MRNKLYHLSIKYQIIIKSDKKLQIDALLVL